MSHPKMLQLLFAVILIVFFAVGCRDTASTSVSETPIATSTPKPPTPTSTPVPPTDTPTPVPPTSTPTFTPTPQPSLSGRIIDHDTGQPIANAFVSVSNQMTVTSTNGEYTLTGLPSGQYILSVTYDGYDPGLSSIFTLADGKLQTLDLTLYPSETTPYPEDPMLTNPLDPNGAYTPEDAERLARLQGLTGEVASIEETKLRGEFLVNYKVSDDVRAAVADLNHEVWKLTDDTDQEWFIIKVCGNLASPVPDNIEIAIPSPKALPLLAGIVIDELIVRLCSSEDCAEVWTVRKGTQVEVLGCLTDGSWCQVRHLDSDSSGWGLGEGLQQRAVSEVIPVLEAVLPTSTPKSTEKIAFISTQHSDETELQRASTDIYVMNPDGSSQTRLNVEFENHEPINYFKYLDWLSQNELAFGLPRGNYKLNLDSGQLSSWNVAYDIFDISNSKQKIGYILREPPFFDIFVANPDGSNSTKVTDTTVRANIFGADWGTFGFTISPDGQKIVFGGGGGQDIGIINTDGSDASILVTLEENGISDHFDWSPDGQRIIFESVGSGSGLRGILSVNVDGSDLKLLFEAPDAGMPVWSPDGQKISFVYNHQIYVMDLDGQNMKQLTLSGFNCCPTWSR